MLFAEKRRIYTMLHTKRLPQACPLPHLVRTTLLEDIELKKLWVDIKGFTITRKLGSKITPNKFMDERLGENRWKNSKNEGEKI